MRRFTNNDQFTKTGSGQTGKAEKRVVFLQACFGAMGLPPTVTHLAARDLWTHTANGTVAVGPSAEGLTVTLAPSAVAMFKMTPSNEYSS